MNQQVNDHLVLISGKSTTGKSTSLRNLRNQEKVLYLNCESGKKLPFKHNFWEVVITDPYQVHDAFRDTLGNPDVEVIVVDSITYLLDMFESMYVLTAPDTRKAWGDFAQYYKHLMQSLVASSDKKVIMTAHTLDTMNEAEMVMESKVPVKGALKNQGIESYFAQVISTKRVSMKELEDQSSTLLNITDEEREQSFKHVFQTRLTKKTINERIRGPMGLFSKQETFIDNDIQAVLDRLDEYYA